MRLRTLVRSDVPVIMALNNAATPAVPVMTDQEMTALLDASDFGFAAVTPTELLGFVVGFRPGSDYASVNYRYFEDRGTDHLYIDRIVVDETARGMRVGQTLYNRVFRLAIAEGRAEITCEVNVEPPNPGSLAFHARLGFSEVGRQPTDHGKTVALFARPMS
ncbi:MAG TPA: GNAT family N-acetyltransferase [Terrimesophilobacter sp.]|jgi:Predicted acetyltransferase, GNAT superfamily|uniref:GNAT family N-acetyltransferase n=1 Tax=Terrimesophilobacter sp. TaxID=2906435 RepID=UPI002F93B271